MHFILSNYSNIMYLCRILHPFFIVFFLFHCWRCEHGKISTEMSKSLRALIKNVFFFLFNGTIFITNDIKEVKKRILEMFTPIWEFIRVYTFFFSLLFCLMTACARAGVTAGKTLTIHYALTKQIRHEYHLKLGM